MKEASAHDREFQISVRALDLAKYNGCASFCSPFTEIQYHTTTRRHGQHGSFVRHRSLQRSTTESKLYRKELQDLILEHAIGNNDPPCTIEMDPSYKSPVGLSVSKATRATFVEHYYSGEFTFHFSTPGDEPACTNERTRL